MSKLGHLESLPMRIRTLSPVYIGSGIKLNKKEYIFIPNGHKIIFVRLDQLVSFLDRRNLLQPFEHFMLGQFGNNGLHEWLQEQSITRADYKSFTHYAISAGDAVDIGSPFREIHTFMKNGRGEPFIPGSSIKGALRTAIAAKLIREERGRYRRMVPELELEAERQRSGKYYLKTQAENLEHALFRTLNLGSKPTNAVNDILRGVQVSDSRPLDPEKLTLCVKIDRRKDGTANINNRNRDTGLLFRECLQPRVEISATLTLDYSVLKGTGLNAEFIKKALDEFEEMYYESFSSLFAEQEEDAEVKCTEGAPLLLGGGVGFPSKTLIYPLAEKIEPGVRLVSRILSKQFPPNHKHEKDPEMGVSPHILKMTKANREYYPMGFCEVRLE